MRKDLYLSHLNFRPATGYKRIWIEDSAQRLSRNGFEPGTMLNAQRRAGPGLNLRPQTLGDYTVSHRHQTPIISLENPMVAQAFLVDELLVRISVGLISIVPSIRAFAVRMAQDEHWTIRDNTVITPRAILPFAATPIHPAGRPMVMEAQITDRNLIAATELIAWAKPAEIHLQADGLAGLTATQFLKGCGWQEISPGFLRR
ncbi:MAG: hypothetical protein PHE83_19115 [Opitutaceae bacterium]|nr:hypothetical protein [Opitutaceae bacterium]